MLKKVVYGLVGLVVIAVLGAFTLYMNPKLTQRLFLMPSGGFDLAAMPPAPDYSSPDAWAALPDRQDNADVVPPQSDVTDNQATALVDVFFVHPTTYHQSDSWNARYDEPGITTEILEEGVLRHQAAVFNSSARIYAPRYRQATIYAFLGEEPETYEALTFAYEDVERAFDYFIDNMSAGRPFILASHSQGSLHAMKLLEEKIAGTPLANRMVAAYIVGYSIPEELDADGISPCANEYSTGCYLNWNSLTSDAKTTGWKQTTKIWIDGVLQHIAGRKITCVNPITGILGATAGPSQNIGGQPFADTGESLRPMIPHLTGAACTDGMLIVSPPTDDDGLTFGVNGGDYHIYDYNLFHMNLRADIARRIEAFWKL